MEYLGTWSTWSMLLYILMGLFALYTIYSTTKQEAMLGTTPDFPWWDKYVFLCALVWTIVATFRVVGHGIGGTDAPTYIYFFENCNSSVYTDWMVHAGDDRLFKWINQGIRYITADYHVYFFCIYGFMAYVYLIFAKEFTPAKTSVIPYVLCFYLFLRSFNTIRSCLAIAFLMVACMMMLKDQWVKAYIIAICSMLVHKASIPFALVIPFCHFFLNHELKIKHVVALIFISSLLGATFQTWFLQYSEDFNLAGSYTYYASISQSRSFLDSFWKIAFEQMLLGLAMVIFRNKISNDIDEEDDYNAKRLNLIKLICYFDFITIPVCFILNIWRGYEYNYIARIIMWGEIIYLITYAQQLNMQKILKALFLVAFIAWMWFRVDRTWEDSWLMPYIFEPLSFIL